MNGTFISPVESERARRGHRSRHSVTPTYTGPNTFAECHGTELDLVSTQRVIPIFAGHCIGWEHLLPRATVQHLGGGRIGICHVVSNRCERLHLSQHLCVHLRFGPTNAIVGGDHVALPIANVYSIPYALGCNPGQWEGEGASYDYFSEVWSEGNCIQNNDPWIDSLWTFTPPGLGDFDWIWTVVDCNGCVDTDTLTIHVVEPTPPILPSLTFCMNDPVGPVTDQTDACWFGPGISPDYIFDPAAAGVGVHEWVVGVGEGGR